jgi:hypothetical protein
MIGILYMEELICRWLNPGNCLETILCLSRLVQLPVRQRRISAVADDRPNLQPIVEQRTGTTGSIFPTQVPRCSHADLDTCTSVNKEISNDSCIKHTQHEGLPVQTMLTEKESGPGITQSLPHLGK